MVDKKSIGTEHYIPIGIMVIVMIATFSLHLMMLTKVGGMISDYDKLDNSQCHIIIINDTFSQIRGSIGSSTYYYIVSDDNTIYELVAGENATKIYKWKTIVKGQEYSLKTYNEYAEFCNDNIVVINQ
jgi:hypothetical protein